MELFNQSLSQLCCAKSRKEFAPLVRVAKNSSSGKIIFGPVQMKVGTTVKDLRHRLVEESGQRGIYDYGEFPVVLSKSEGIVDSIVAAARALPGIGGWDTLARIALGAELKPVKIDGEVFLAVGTVDPQGFGLLQQWNTENPLHNVQCGDFITQVNDVRGQDMINEIKNTMELALVVQRGPPKADEVVLTQWPQGTTPHDGATLMSLCPGCPSSQLTWPPEIAIIANFMYAGHTDYLAAREVRDKDRQQAATDGTVQRALMCSGPSRSR